MGVKTCPILLTKKLIIQFSKKAGVHIGKQKNSMSWVFKESQYKSPNQKMEFFQMKIVLDKDIIIEVERLGYFFRKQVASR